MPILKPCTTEHQKENAIVISKILWMILVTDSDTEENIYNVLYEIIKNHEEKISFGVLYFHKMKKSLSDKELKIIRDFYKKISIQFKLNKVFCSINALY